MKIKEIEIKKLFNNFNYKIPINQVNNATIIIGPNGSGKTVILNMLNSITNNNFSVFSEVPFKSFNIIFDNDTSISIVRSNKSNKKNRMNKSTGVEISYFNNNEKKDSYFIAFPLLHATRYTNDIRYIDSGKEVTYINSVPMAFREWENYRNCIKSRSNDMPWWYKELKGAIKTVLIGTDRLYINKKSDNNKNNIGSTVVTYSKELAMTIQKKFSEFSSISMALDKTFPYRLIEQQSEYKLNEKQLFEQLKELEYKRGRLKDAGLFYDNDDTNLNVLLKGNASEKNILTEVLAIYCADTNKKLSIFDNLLIKIELFKNIIDRLFMYKKISFDKVDGFIFRSLNNEDIPIGSLSSGEQHEIVLLYELIFKVEENTILLIDEPEISLHIFWQQQFLDDMQNICKVSNIKAIIATHSASIINNNWNLTVDLEEQQDEEVY